ncbi:hypothetical protein IQ07DRAFT_595495 [Pyrenochaeta sp. DS3sAY3a]|nr:hypothetical protein IQ07DRAFT_595495 [Pyrenochaeta sp. DS3sAY3a]
MKSFTLAAASTLLATTYASTVTLSTTPCLDLTIPTEQFSIELNTANPVVKDLPSVCGLRILSASADIDVRTISCQAFRDAEGTQPGSAVFTYDEPALIATNPVQEKAILCTVNAQDATVSLKRRQNEENSTAPSVSTTQTSTRAQRSTLFRTITASLPEGSAAGNSTANSTSTTVTTAIASASSGLPSSSRNATVPSNTGRPTATQTQPPAESTGAAATIGMGAGVVVAGLFAMLL